MIVSFESVTASDNVGRFSGLQLPSLKKSTLVFEKTEKSPVAQKKLLALLLLREKEKNLGKLADLSRIVAILATLFHGLITF